MSLVTRLRLYYYRNRREILIFLITASIGVAIAGINSWNYNQSTNIYKIGSDDISQEFKTMRRDKAFEVSMPIRDPESLSYVTIKVGFGNVSRTATLDIFLNGDTIDSEVTNLLPGSVQTFTPDTEILQRRNRLKISGEFPSTGSATVNSVEVTGYGKMQRYLFFILNLLAIIITLGPTLIIKYFQYREKSEIEDRFPDFLRDVVEGTRSGMTLPQSIENAQDNDYGKLNPYVSQMNAKLDWGIPFQKVLKSFGNKTNSKIIMRASNTIIQTYQSGGNVTEVLETVSNNIKEIKDLRRERESSLYGEMVTGYIVYFIFLAVIVMLIKYLVPSLGFTGDIGPLSAGSGQSAKEMVNQYRPIFRHLVIIQSIFSGLVIGKLSAGELKAGAKHVGILLLVGYTVTAVFI
ncbi:MAG: type II secretion system F family protein [Candidatus Nanohaloarchaeota archaeon QJJ-9]|nr:type II secretion system F family protein [Candidatus Nanohaloarchaeota archaeon QJJ-9]